MSSELSVEAVLLSDESMEEFWETLLVWFGQHGRSYPWRQTLNPYDVLIAERLLQQTAARDHVVHAYRSLLTHYPSPHELAQAQSEELEEIIRPLGLLYRARQLVEMAKEIVGRYGGTVPCQLEELLALTGVGDYAARAVLSFACMEHVPVVDTNVARFLYRFLGLEGSLPANPARKKGLIELARRLLPHDRSRDYNLAVLDLCAAICTSRNPRCPVCPVSAYCLFGSKPEAQPPA